MQRYFQLAKRMAQKSPSRYQLGAVVLNKRGHIISTGNNDMTKTHPKHKTWGNFVHAELDALLGLNPQDTKNGTVYVYRETRNGELANARPCPICEKAIRLYKIRKICYTVSGGYKEEYLND